jgi:hypothetical protein
MPRKRKNVWNMSWQKLVLVSTRHGLNFVVLKSVGLSNMQWDVLFMSRAQALAHNSTLYRHQHSFM